MTAAVVPWRNRIVGHADVAPDQLLANPGNWRTHPGSQRSALRGSLDELGWVQSVIVNQQTGHVVDGHARVEEALSRGVATVPVVFVELSIEEEKLALAIIDPIAGMAGMDRERLDELLADVRVDDAALASLLVDLGGPESRAPGLVDPDDAPALRDPDVAPGELWALGEHRLLCGDATDDAAVAALLGPDPVDLVWTDPPYGVVYEGKTDEHLRLTNDELVGDPLRALVAGALRLSQLRPGGTFYLCSPSGPNLLPFLLALTDAGWPHRQTIVWVKDRFVLGHSDFHYRHEPMLAGELPGPPPAPSTYPAVVDGKDADPIAYGWAPGAPHRFNGDRRVDSAWEIPRPAASREHPTMKPVELVARSIEYGSLRGERVFDPFAGSGTTIIAAQQTGRHGLAMELDPRYAQVVIDRWEAFTGLTATRLERPPAPAENRTDIGIVSAPPRLRRVK